jgi:hypothetical protein
MDRAERPQILNQIAAVRYYNGFMAALDQVFRQIHSTALHPAYIKFR